tara:strand:+ start:1002 stop:1304 length:303 start_codon:yes stop_codon:yes gene_type:complete
MKKLFLLSLIPIFLFFNACQTIDKKTEEIVKKENEKLGKFIGQTESELKIVMGKPDEEIKGDNGVRFLIYKSKKYVINCERKFEIDDKKMVTGFSSRGCF